MRHTRKTKNPTFPENAYWLSETARGIKFVLVAFVALAPASSALPEWRTQGVVVEAIVKNSAGDRSGFRPGDIVRTWSRNSVKGDVQSPFDLMDVEAEQTPRGPVVLAGQRGSEVRYWSMGPTEWGIRTRPVLAPALLNAYSAAQALERAGRRSEASQYWRASAVNTQEVVAPWLTAWFLFHAAESLAEASQWKECDEVYHRAIEQASAAGPRILALLLQAWADTFSKRGDWARAEKYYQQELEEYRKIVSVT